MHTFVNRAFPAFKLALLLAFVFLGTLFWTGQRDPFHRLWFKAHHPQGAASCVAVLPKTQPRPMPVVIYLHGSGGSVVGSGNDLRAIAEMGIATVGMDYCQTNGARFEAEFTALLDYVRRQRWADTNRTAWLGYSLGAQRQLSYTLSHPKRAPALLARLGGGMVPEKAETAGFPPHSKVLILHGRTDEVFPIADAEKLAAILRAQGASVDYRVLEDQGHGLGENRAVVFRFLGEYFLEELAGDGALRTYRSAHSWQKAAKPLWLYLLPALVACAWFAATVRNRHTSKSREASGVRRIPPLCNGESTNSAGMPRTPNARARFRSLFHHLIHQSNRTTIPETRGGHPISRALSTALWIAAILLAVAAAGQVSLRCILPRIDAAPRSLALARRVLVQERERADFDYLAREHATGQKIGPLVEHAHLANYNRQLVNWKIDDPLYREYVLSPRVGEATGCWRRTLWESFYPRIRNAQDTQTAAQVVARHLRERVTITDGPTAPASIADAWLNQKTDRDGFAAIYVAALRSCGVPARMNPSGNAEFWTGTEWTTVPDAKL